MSDYRHYVEFYPFLSETLDLDEWDTDELDTSDRSLKEANGEKLREEIAKAVLELPDERRLELFDEAMYNQEYYLELSLGVKHAQKRGYL